MSNENNIASAESEAREISDEQINDTLTRVNFPPEEANYQSRVMTRWLAVDMHYGHSCLLPELLAKTDLQEQAKLLQRKLPLFMSHAFFEVMWDHLCNWGRHNGRITPRSSGPVWNANSPLWKAMSKEIDWSYVIGKLKNELDQHGHRNQKHWEELAMGKPFEHIEADKALKRTRRPQTAS